jgi:hypothetical protein
MTILRSVKLVVTSTYLGGECDQNQQRHLKKKFNQTMYSGRLREPKISYSPNKSTSRKKGTCAQGFCGWPSDTMAHRPVAVAGMLVETVLEAQPAMDYTSSTPRSPFR